VESPIRTPTVLEPHSRKRAQGVRRKHNSENTDDSPTALTAITYEMSLITSENVHQLPQWRITPLGLLIVQCACAPPAQSDPPLDTIRTKNVELEKGTKTKKKRTRAPPMRVRRQTVDLLHWGSTHLSGIYLDGNGSAPLPRRTGPDGDGSVKGESTEVQQSSRPRTRSLRTTTRTRSLRAPPTPN
jgi:hypothetical protein